MAAAGVFLLSACTASPAPAAAPEPTAIDSPDEVVTIEMPDLPDRPGRPKLTPAEVEELRLAGQEERWTSVVQAYPDAVRPAIEFEGFVELGPERYDVLADCYESFGVPLSSADDPGNLGVVSAGGSTKEAAIATFICESTHPSPVFAPLTDEELGWFYDYLTEFVAPCYKANGINTPAPPSRADFVAEWPQQGWFPTAPEHFFENEALNQALREACPIPTF